jgi:hypothetical protein
VLAVGSVDNIETTLMRLNVFGVEHAPITYLAEVLAPFPVVGKKSLYATAADSSVVDDACTPLPSSTPNLADYVVLVRRGACTFAVKLANIKAKGATAAIVYNNGGVFAPVNFGDSGVHAVMVDTADGEFLAANKDKIQVEFPRTNVTVAVPAATGGLVSDFSTYGPTNDMFFKPAVSGVGGNIVATWPLALGGWVSISGVRSFDNGLSENKEPNSPLSLDFYGHSSRSRRRCSPT